VVEAASESHANKLLKEFEKEIMRDELPVPRGVTFKQLWELYMRDHVNICCKPMTRQWYDECGKRLLVSFGHLRVTSIKPTQISNYYAALKDPTIKIGELEGGVSDETVRHHHRALRAVFNFAKRYKIIKDNPMEGIKLPPAKKTHSRAFTDEELPAVFSALADQPLKWQALCITGLTATMRREELIGLKWSDISFSSARVVVQRAVQYTKDDGIMIDDTKTDSSMRVINLPYVTVSILLAWQAEQRKLLVKRIDQIRNVKVINKEALTYLEELRARLKDFENEYVWNQNNGDPMLPHSVTSWWSKFIKKNNLPHVTFHGCRHTGATITIAEGMDVRSVASRLGHADASMTLRVYAQALQSTDRKIAQKWDEIIEKNAKWHTNGTFQGNQVNDKK
jgi:integrase